MKREIDWLSVLFMVALAVEVLFVFLMESDALRFWMGFSAIVTICFLTSDDIGWRIFYPLDNYDKNEVHP